MTKHRIYSVSVASVYPYYVAKAEKKGRTKAEVDEVICWLTGHSQETLDDQLAKKTNFEDCGRAPVTKPHREPSLVTSPRACGQTTARCYRARSPASKTTSRPASPT